MKKKADNANVWNGSTLVHRAEPAGAGLKPWTKLSALQKERFTDAFLADDSWSERVEAFKRTKGSRHSLAAILHGSPFISSSVPAGRASPMGKRSRLHSICSSITGGYQS